MNNKIVTHSIPVDETSDSSSSALLTGYQTVNTYHESSPSTVYSSSDFSQKNYNVKSDEEVTTKVLTKFSAKHRKIQLINKRIDSWRKP